MATKRIEDLTSDILKHAGFFKPPVDIKKIAKLSGVKVKISDLGEEASAFLVIKNQQALIGINPDESSVRQRFSIAHELGHYFLHRQKNDSLFVSKLKNQKHYRDENSSTGELKKEREANGFAAAILMPKDMLEKSIESLSPYFFIEDAIKSLAKTYNVSQIAMSIRLTNIGLIKKIETLL